MDKKEYSYANISNLNAIEDLHKKYLENPESVDLSWRYFFEGVAFSSNKPASTSLSTQNSPDLKIHLLIQAYRQFGHLMASFNPLAIQSSQEPSELNLISLGFKQTDLDTLFPTCQFLKESSVPLKTLIDTLKKTYCGTIGVEYIGLGAFALETWLQHQIEPLFPLHFTPAMRLKIMEQLNRAELFEHFIHTKYTGQKRFSLEGAETLIPMLSAMIETGAELDISECVLGMAHRGRLNVLANILNKSYTHIFHEFEDHYITNQFEGTGDVKYHKGFIGTLQSQNGKKITVTLVANPSHLESVDPVVEGIVKAKCNQHHTDGIVPILIHGDAALAGQGVVYETMQMNRLKGYCTGGTIHLVINNHIGFTTTPQDARSTLYCTDIAKAFGAPVFHVNAEDPEECVRVAQLAMQIRHQFQCDVFIDLNCYRKYGHNESDEPTFSQPLEYALIKNKKTIRTLFKEKLIAENMIDEAAAAQLEDEFKQQLNAALQIKPSDQSTPTTADPLPDIPLSAIPTSVTSDQLLKLTHLICTVPEGFKIHPKIGRLLQDRIAMMHADPMQPSIDWGMGELISYATLLDEQIHIRLSGQDVRRGTFSHRHAMWIDQTQELKYCPLSHISPSQARFDIFNSPLSEFAVLGFDFGYSIAYPNSLVIWEAQFGDFVNGAQIIIDQYITASEQKWGLHTNLVLLLPHGYEGQGPEHSSARIERFLQLAGHNNTRIVNCTTPAQLFHLIRSQALNTTKKPLIVFTPKALLRHPLCISPLNELINGSFKEVIDDPNSTQNPRTLLFCSGKMYYDLLKERENKKIDHVVIIRIEQLYPFPTIAIQDILQKYKEIRQCIWVQEEHRNMGPWEYIHTQFTSCVNQPIYYVGREISASTAVGSHKLHQQQYETLINQAFKV